MAVDLMIPISLSVGFLTNSTGLILLSMPLSVIGLILGIAALARDKFPLWQRAAVLAGPFVLPGAVFVIGKILG